MPELPEIETFARLLRPALVGKTIVAASVHWARSLAEPEVDAFIARIAGQAILETGRRAKFLRLRLAQDWLIFHLRMSGDLRIRPLEAPPSQHDRLILHLSDGNALAFHDPRKFGRVWLVSDPEGLFQHLGPEPLADSFTAAELYARLQTHRRQLKPLLLDQSFLAGVGNIYADESLHQARLHPLALANRLSADQAQALWAALRSVLNEGIRRNGASIDWVYRGGNFQNHFCVYQRAGQPCFTCGAAIERIIIGQRSTHFCPICQKI